MIKKLIVLVVLVLVFSVAVLPGLIGFGVESEFSEAQARLGEAMGTTLRVERFARGWFGSEATVCGTYPRLGSDTCATYEIEHGPLLWTPPRGVGWFAARIDVDWPAPLRARLEPVFGDRAPFLLHVGMGFDNVVRVHLGTADGSYEHDGESIRFASMTVESRLDLGSERVEGEMTWPRFAMGERLSFANLRSTFDSTPVEGGWWLGETTWSIEDLAARDEDNNHYAAAKIRVSSRSDVTETDQAQLEATLDGDKLVGIGLAEPIDAGLTLSITGIPLTALQALQRAADPTLAANEPTRSAVTKDAVDELARSGAVLDLSRFDVRSGNDSLAGSLRVELPPMEIGADTTIGSVLEKASAKGELRATRTLAERILGPNGMQQWLTTGLARVDGADVHVPIDFAEGKIRIGKTEIPLALLIALAGAAK